MTASRCVALAAAALLLGSCRRAAEPRAETPRSVPIAAPDASLLPIPPASASDLDARTRELIRKRELELEGRIADRGRSRSDLAAAYGQLGQAYQAFGLFEAAIPCYENAQRLDPQVFAWPYLLGRVQAELTRIDLAVAALEKALLLQPTDLPARVFLGDLQRTAGRLEAARSAYEKALQLSPDCAPAWSGLGQIAFIEGDYPRAVDGFEKALRAEPHASRIHYPLALAYRKLGAREKAERHMAQRGPIEASLPDPLLDGVLELNPYTLTQRGLEALQSRRFPRAIALLRTASEAFPENVEVRLQLAAAIAFTGAHEEALAQYREALRLQPQNPHVHYNLGTTLRMLGRDEEALVHLRRAVELHPEYPEAQFNLAQTLRHMGRDAEALAPLDAILSLDPTDQRARMARARLLARLGKCPEAVASVEEGLAIAKESVPLTDLLARLLAACPEGAGRDAPRAQRLARKAFAAGATAEHAATVAFVEASRGGWKEAASWQRRALGLLPASAPPELREELGEPLRSYEASRPVPVEW